MRERKERKSMLTVFIQEVVLDVLAEEELDGLADLLLLLRNVLVKLGVVPLGDSCGGWGGAVSAPPVIIASKSARPAPGAHPDRGPARAGSRRSSVELKPRSMASGLTDQFVLLDEATELSARNQLAPLSQHQLRRKDEEADESLRPP